MSEINQSSHSSNSQSSNSSDTLNSPRVSRKTSRARETIASDEHNSSDSAASSRCFEEIKELFQRDPHLYQIIVELEYPVTGVITLWNEHFHNQPEEATFLLINFIMACCGCNVEEFSMDVLKTPSQSILIVHIIKWMIANLKQNENHPILSKGKKYDKFVDIISDFWTAFVKLCQHSFIQSDYFQKFIVQFLIQLADYQEKNEHNAILTLVATFTALKIATNLLKITSSNENIPTIFKCIKEYVYENYVHSNHNKLVTICATEYCQWILHSPNILIEDWDDKESIGKSIFVDSYKPVRQIALKGLLKMFEKYKNDLNMLENIIPVVVKISGIYLKDSNHTIVKDSIKLLTIIKELNGDAIEDWKESCILYHLYNPHIEISKQAAQYLNYLFVEVHNIQNDKIYIENLATLYMETVEGRNVEQLIKSLDGINDAIVNWPAMIDILQNDLNENDYIALCSVRIITQCIIQATSDEGQKNLKNKAEMRSEVTKNFGQVIGDLIKQNKNRDPEILVRFLEIPRYFDFDIIKNEGFIEPLLEVLCTMMTSEYDDIVLNAVSNTLQVLYQMENKTCTNDEKYSNKLIELFGRVIKLFVEYYGIYKGHMISNQSLSQNCLEAYLSSTKQLYAMFYCHNLNVYDLWDIVMESLKTVREYFNRTYYSSRTLNNTMKVLSVSLVWEKFEFNQNKDTIYLDSQMIDHWKKIQKSFNEYIKEATDILIDKEQMYDYELKAEIFKQTCEVKLRLNEFQVDERFADALSQFLDDYIFVEILDSDSSVTQRNKEINKILIESYSKLIVFNRNIFKLETIAKHYFTYANLYGDIIAKTITQLAAENRPITIGEIFNVLVKNYLDAIKNGSVFANEVLNSEAKHFTRILKVNSQDSDILEHLFDKIILVSAQHNKPDIFIVLSVFSEQMLDDSKQRLLEKLNLLLTKADKDFKHNFNVNKYIMFLENKIQKKTKKQKKTQQLKKMEASFKSLDLEDNSETVHMSSMDEEETEV